MQVSYLEGEYKDDCLEGLARILWKDGTWTEGFFKGGVLHGFARRFDADKHLTFIGMYRWAELLFRGFRFYFGSVLQEWETFRNLLETLSLWRLRCGQG